MRANALRKSIEYWCIGKIVPKFEETHLVMNICDVFGLKKSNFLVDDYLWIIEDVDIHPGYIF
jgi:hypothetical protein